MGCQNTTSQTHEMNYMGIIITGVLIMFGLPIALGIVLAIKVDVVTGIVAGVVAFLGIAGIAYRNMKKIAGKK